VVPKKNTIAWELEDRIQNRKHEIKREEKNPRDRATKLMAFFD
jgi:hypothetical protein